MVCSCDSDSVCSDKIIIDGISLALDETLNEAFFREDTIKTLHETFIHNKPFPYLVIDGLFPPKLLRLVHADFARLSWSEWRRYDNSNEVKRASIANPRLGHASEFYFNTIYSSRFVNFLERVSGIPGLVTDPSLSAGGLHDIPPGGKFAMHIDFNLHPVTRLDNRLVFITYLNEDWRSSYGGALELWDLETNAKGAEVTPEFGRSVLFYQSSKSLHGHPKPIEAPNERHRRSVAAYYYSNGRSDGDIVTAHCIPNRSQRRRAKDCRAR
ncbi:2OG-Fe(II) oxygenase [Methylocella silvestris]|uniref:Prolyl 4-hydroxylase alpha subunit Fe(2+) 2OG dioxygenase domain-containing protein n=1 Tax=Methylocella silvestris TaxID=199596 RepID=A0A2J7TID4_METSI|nr:2OG-Fe(II) oxygenase [Methylocella silvestris]PNG26532.1 hypothetical protein CR492_07505 [Methylocella silvestris]